MHQFHWLLCVITTASLGYIYTIYKNYLSLLYSLEPITIQLVDNDFINLTNSKYHLCCCKVTEMI